jgi:predicted nucleic acid-binding protein
MVIDASVAVEVILKTELGLLALDRLEQEPEVHVPEHFHIEAISVLRRKSLHGELDDLPAARSLALLHQMRVVRFPVMELSDAIWELRDNLTAYDAAYLALARRIGSQLMTIDEGLAAAARAEGRLVELSSKRGV